MHPTFGEEDQIHGVEAVTPKTTKEKVSNFFYHYKWPFYGSIFVLVIVIICSIQFCHKETYTHFVMYSGDAGLVSLQNRDIQYFLDDVCKVENPDNQLSFTSLFVANSEELKASGNENSGTLAAQSHKNRETFFEEIQTGNILVLLLSPSLFEELNQEGIFLSFETDEILSRYKQECDAEIVSQIDAGLIGENKTGLKLSALPSYQDSALSALPEDTVLCIRCPSAISEWFNSLSKKKTKETEEKLESHKEFVLNLLGYEIEEP